MATYIQSVTLEENVQLPTAATQTLPISIYAHCSLARDHTMQSTLEQGGEQYIQH